MKITGSNRLNLAPIPKTFPGKKFFAILALLSATTFSSLGQGLVNFTGGSSAATRISTNSVVGGASSGLIVGTGNYIFALFYSTNASSVNGQTAPIIGLANNNYAFNDSAWKFAGYATNTAAAGRLFGANRSDGSTIIPDVPGGVTARLVVIGWSANLIGPSIGSLVNWYNAGNPFSSGLIGQSVVSSPVTLGDGGIIFTPAVFGVNPNQVQGFVLGTVDALFYNPTYITTHPTNQTATIGGTVYFQARAYGDAALPFSYQWRINGTNIYPGGNYSMSVFSQGPNVAEFTLAITNAQLTNAGNYSVSIFNSAGSATSSNALLTITGGAVVAPGIVNQPANVAALVGSDVSFAVTANGSSPISYQWKFNGTNIASATNAALPLLNVQLTDAGNYSVTITNGGGVTNSTAAVLTVSPGLPPSITSQPLPQMVQVGNNAVLTVGVTGSAPLSYQWSYNGSNLAGATNATLLLNSVQTNKAGTYAVTIANAFGATNSLGALLTVFPPSGYVFFGVNVTPSSKIYTNSSVGGAATGQTGTKGGTYIYMMFASATATNVNGQSVPILGAATVNYAFNDTNWTLVAYGTNTFRAGRLAGITPDSSGRTPVAGFEGGTFAQFVVIGWSAGIGLDLSAVKTWFNNGSVSSDGWIGQSAVSGAILLGDDAIIPSMAIFGSGASQLAGFTLGLVSPVAHRSYSVPYSPPAILSAVRSGSNLQLTWPLDAGSFSVQSANNPSGPWSDLTLSIGNDGVSASASVPITSQVQFFRLIVQ